MEKIGKWNRVHRNDVGPIRDVYQHEDDPELLGYIQLQGNLNGKPDPKFLNRIESLKGLDHPNILNLLDYDLEAERPYMVTELCKGGTLGSTNLSEWTVEEKKQCFYQICEAFAYLWDHGLVKGDHNFKNIFLKEDKTPVIGDFESTSTISKDAEGVAKILHTAGYTFWEIMEEKGFNSVLAKERQINKQIESLTSQLEELQQQKAQLLS